MAETDLSTWLSIGDAAAAIGCSTRTIERLGRSKQLEQRLRRQEGTPPVAVYNPDDVARIASERRRAPAPFVLPAVGTSNGNGHRAQGSGLQDTTSTSALSQIRDTDDPIRLFCAAMVRVLQSPPSPPLLTSLAESRGGERLFLTIREASVVSGLTLAYLRRACESGTLKAVKDRGWRIRRKDLEQL